VAGIQVQVHNVKDPSLDNVDYVGINGIRILGCPVCSYTMESTPFTYQIASSPDFNYY
jgi:hypothetical protein